MKTVKAKISLRLFAFVAAALALWPAVSGAAQQTPRRIKFERGATKASVAGRLRGRDDKARYLIRLRAGQTMSVSAEGRCADCNTDVEVKSPAGAHDTVDPDMCQCRVEVTNTAAGDYLITVGESRKGGRWRGAFVLSVEVR